MAQSSLLLSTSTSNGVIGPFIGNPVRSDGWYGRVDHIYTIGCYVSNFTGTVYFEASLADVPGDGDWFPVLDPISFPRLPAPFQPNGPTSPTLSNIGQGETAAIPLNFRANVTWIRARADQTGVGFVDRIILSQ